MGTSGWQHMILRDHVITKKAISRCYVFSGVIITKCTALLMMYSCKRKSKPELNQTSLDLAIIWQETWASLIAHLVRNLP